jgi:hypothetical protein
MKTDNKKILIAVVVILALGALFFSLKEDTKSPVILEEEGVVIEETQTKVYRNDTYAFSFEYPEQYEVLEYNPTRISVGESGAEGFVSVADITLIQSEVDNMQSFEEFVLDQARLTCAADRPNTSISCIEIKDLKPSSGPEEADAQTFSLVAETTTEAGVVGISEKGPYYTVNTSPNTLGLMSFLMIHNPIHRSVEEADRGTLETIIQSLVISERQYR